MFEVAFSPRFSSCIRIIGSTTLYVLCELVGIIIGLTGPNTLCELDYVQESCPGTWKGENDRWQTNHDTTSQPQLSPHQSYHDQHKPSRFSASEPESRNSGVITIRNINGRIIPVWMRRRCGELWSDRPHVVFHKRKETLAPLQKAQYLHP